MVRHRLAKFFAVVAVTLGVPFVQSAILVAQYAVGRRSLRANTQQQLLRATDSNQNEGNNDKNNSNNPKDKDVCPSSSVENSLIDKQLTRPFINLRPESLLFSENPATAANNTVLTLWNACKRRLPIIVTGAHFPDTADDNPLAGLYNMMLIRIPTIVAGIVYIQNLVQGHPLVVDFGDGPFEMSPVVVAATLYWILR